MAHEAAPVILLTGASRGIGHATVKYFQERGWRILTVSRKPFSQECEWPSARENHIVGDLSDAAGISKLACLIKERLPEGRLNALVNNAGISPKGPNGSRLGIADTSEETWQTVLNVNLVSVALLTRSLIDNLIAAKGSIVNVTSIAGTRVHPFAGCAYAASKAALAALTREIAHEFGPHGVRANAIAPGEIETSILSPGTDAIVAQSIPMKRLGSPREVARTIHFLCAPASSYINGAELHINGGQHV